MKDKQRHQGGFTLLELLVVLTLSAMLVGIVAVRLRQPYREAQFEDAIDRIPFVDQLVRSRSRQFVQNAELVLDLDENKVFARSPVVGSSQRLQTILPDSARMDCVTVAGKSIYRGFVVIPVAPGGQTPSYAVRLQLDNHRRCWLLFAGITGQVSEYENETDVKQILQLLDPNGNFAR